MKRTEPYYKKHWLDSLEVFLDGYNYDNDNIVIALENQITKTYQRKYAVAVNSATNGIFMSLYVWSKIHPDRNEVIIPNWGYPAAFKACMVLGLEPVPVDINEHTLGMDIEEMTKYLDTRTLAVIHIENNGIMGQAADIATRLKIKDPNVLFIEDAAPSMLQIYAGRYGDVSIFSFSPTKPFMAGEGGVILTDDKDIYNNLKQLRHTPNYEDRGPSLNFRMSPFLASYLIPQLHFAPYLTRMREMVHLHYSQRLDVFREYSNRHGAIMYLSDKAKKISKKLSQFGVEHRYRYYPCYIDSRRNFPVSCRVREQIIDLPMHHKLEEEHINMICRIIKRAEND